MSRTRVYKDEENPRQLLEDVSTQLYSPDFGMLDDGEVVDSVIC
jgi:hypothetical protein